MKKVTVMGAGNGGLTAAYCLAKNGHEVCIYDTPKYPKQIDAIKAQGGIEALAEFNECKMLLPGFADIALATTDIKEAMEFSDIFMMICPSFAQEIMFADMLPHLRDGMTILLIPGNYGGLVLHKILRNSEQADKDITFVDTISLPWATRIAEDGKITIMGVKEFMPMSIFPKSKKTDALTTLLEEVFPIPVEFLDNPIVAALENINFGSHPVLATLNMGLLEKFDGNFNFYGDCCTPSIAKVEDALDLERLAVGECMHMKLRTELEGNNILYGMHEKSMYEFNSKSSIHAKIKNAPSNPKARYITEDVPYLFVPFCELADVCGIDAPIAKAIVLIASIYNDEDYMKTGRTLSKMGFTGWSKQEIMEFLEK